MCIHAYYDPSQAEEIAQNITNLSNKYGYKFWLNEFSCPPWLKKYTEDDNLKLMNNRKYYYNNL